MGPDVAEQAPTFWLTNDADYTRVPLSAPALPDIASTPALQEGLDSGRIMAAAGAVFQVETGGRPVQVLERAKLGRHARLGWFWIRVLGRGGAL